MKSIFLKVLALTLFCVLLIPIFSGCISIETPETPSAETSVTEATTETTTSTTTTSSTTASEQKQEDPDPFLKMTEKERAFYILNMDINDLAYVNSYTQSMNMTYLGTYFEEELQISVEASGIFSNLRSSDKGFYFTEMTTNVESDAFELSESMKQKNGYVDGKMFEYLYNSAEEYAYSSPVTVEEYRNYLNMPSLGDDFNDIINENSCDTVSCEQEADGTWTATFTDFTDKGISELDRIFGDIRSMMEENIVDYEIKVSVDKDYYPKSVVMNAEFGGDNSNAFFTLSGRFSDFNSTYPVDIDLSDYTEIDNLIYLLIAQKAIDNAQNAKKTSFDYKNISNITGSDQTVQSVQTEYDIEVNNSNDSYFFDLDGAENGVPFKYSYKDNILTVVIDGENFSLDYYDDSVARSFVKSYFDPAELGIDSGITKVEIEGNDYIFTVSNLGFDDTSVTNVNSYIKVTLDNYKLVSYEFFTSFDMVEMGDEYSIEVCVTGRNFVIIE